MQKIQLIAGGIALACVLACGKTSTESAISTEIQPKDTPLSAKISTENTIPPAKPSMLQQIITFVKKGKTEKPLLVPNIEKDSLAPNIVQEENKPAILPEKAFEMPLLSPQSLMQSLSAAPKAFSIPAQEPTSIQLPQGTQILIPQEAFIIEETGEAVKGNVLLLAQEYLSIKDILRANLSTVSTEGMLETGGMLYLEAQYEGKRCALKKDKRIQFLLPTQGRKKEKNMQLFAGEKDEEGQLVWNPLEAPDFTVQDTFTRQYTNKIQDFKDFVNTSIGYFKHYSWLNMNRPVIKVKSVRVRQGGILTDMDTHIRCPRNYFSVNEFPVNYCEVAWGKEGGTFTKKRDKSLVFRVNIQADLATGNLIFPRYPGDLKEIPVGMSHYIMRSIRRHRWTPGENEAEFEIFVADKYKKILEDQYGAGQVEGDCEEHYNKKYTDYVKDFKPVTYYYSNAYSSAKQQMKNYIFSTTKLGWINCDRFLQTQAKADLIVDIGKTSDLQAFVIFHKIRSVLSANTWEAATPETGLCHFPNVPFGEKVTILVIKTQDNKQYYALKETQISEKTEKDLDFQPLDRQVLAALTQDLGRKFD